MKQKNGASPGSNISKYYSHSLITRSQDKDQWVEFIIKTTVAQ